MTSPNQNHESIVCATGSATPDSLLEQERSTSGVAYDPRSQEIHEDPYPLLSRIRSIDPIHWSFLLNGWLLTRHADAMDFLRQPNLSKDLRKAKLSQLGTKGVIAPSLGLPTLIHMDPPDHTRLRGLVSKAFTAKTVASLAPRIETMSEELIDALSRDGAFDLIADFANPLPVMVIAEMLGVSKADQSNFKKWSNDFLLGNDVSGGAEARSRGQDAKTSLIHYFREEISRRRGKDKDDLLGALIRAEGENSQLSEDELLGTCIMLLVAGNETTTNLIGNGTLALLKHPNQIESWLHTPELGSNAIEELLRFDSPVQVVQRVATVDMELRGRLIESGTMVMTLVGAVNRDPEVFEHPDVLDISRQNIRQLSFGHGIHHCLGAPLARTVAGIAIPQLLRRFPDMTVAVDRPTWRNSAVFRGLRALPVVENGRH